MTLPVFLGHETSPVLDQVKVGESLTLHGDEARHAVKVKRLTPGEGVDIVNGCGLRVRGTVSAAQGMTMIISVDAIMTEEAPRPRLTLIQALAKGGRDEQAIEQATEVGVDHVIAWQARRSIVKWVGAKAVKALGKWGGVVEAAAKQSRRAWVPEVEGPCDSVALTRWISQVIAGGGIVFIAHEEGVDGLANQLRQLGDRLCEVNDIAVIVGPEGGITSEELADFQQAGARVVLLGPHVMRSSSAGAAALTLISAAIGRW